MNWIVSIFNMANKNWASRVFTLVLIFLLTYSSTQFFTAKAKIKCEDCTPYQKIAEEVINALSRKEVAENFIQSDYMFASFISDTTKPQKMTPKEFEKYKDSVLTEAKRKLDSLKKSKT